MGVSWRGRVGGRTFEEFLVYGAGCQTCMDQCWGSVGNSWMDFRTKNII